MEDAGDVERFRRHLDDVVDVGEAGDERRDTRADAVHMVIFRIPFTAR